MRMIVTTGEMLATARALLGRGFRRAPVAGARVDGSVFAVAPDAEPITSDDVARALGEYP